MRAAVFSQFGEPAAVLQVQDVPEPALAKGLVRVAMIASPVNPSDLMTIRGIYGKVPDLPAVPGYEGVGIVVAADAGLYGRLMLNKRVAVLNPGTGNWQEQTVLPVKNVVPLPASLTDEQAAMFFVNPAAAYLMTQKVLQVPKGDWLLQSAAGSAVGRMVIRLGQRFGFRTLNVVRRDDQVRDLLAAGGDAVVVFDPDHSTPEDFAHQVREKTGGGVRFAIDPVGGPTGSAMVPCLTDRGRMLVYGTLSPDPLTFSSRSLMTIGASVEGFWLSRYMSECGLLAKLSLMRTIGGLIRDGILTAEVGATYPLERVVDAVRAAEEPGKAG
ncbi:MAG TPA: zinc-dependent alcohol dehydrogenase family protein [Planctomycetaceae bacterium]|nr:zinc-dependent alcohol dehydrogenase family protein [Planctomycetaceae bacterium]